MVTSRSQNNHKLYIGCGLGIILLFFIFAAVGLTVLRVERNAAIYPDSVIISNNSNYKNLPSIYVWSDAYQSQDDFNTVFNWYSQKFNMGPESRAIGSCAGMDKVDSFLWMRRDISVFICQTERGQMIFVDRVTHLR